MRTFYIKVVKVNYMFQNIVTIHCIRSFSVKLIHVKYLKAMIKTSSRSQFEIVIWVRGYSYVLSLFCFF